MKLVIIFVLLAFQSARGNLLTGTEREEKLNPLLASGWTLVEGRDAIYKEYVFKNFNEVWNVWDFLCSQLYVL